MGHKNNHQSGQSIVIMAFAIVVLMGIMALAIDGGRIYTLRRDAQNAADAAALQGARALCRDEDYIAIATDVAKRGGFSGAGIVEVNSPPLYSDAPIVTDDQVEVVITATIDGGLIAPVVYQGELNTRVHAVGYCQHGTLSGSGSAIFSGAPGCPGNNEVDLTGSSITVIGGVHANDDVHIGGGGGGSVITGTVSYGNGTDISNQTVLVPPTPVQVTEQDYPIDIGYYDFRPASDPGASEDGWAYLAIMAANPSAYHYYAGEVTKSVLQSQGWISGNTIQPGVYVSPAGFKFSGSGGDGLIGDDVTFVSLADMDFSGNNTMLRPYFSGLLLLTDGNGDPCANSSVINMSGSTVSWGGIIFAPNGKVNMSFSSNSTFFGSIIAGTVSVSGSETMIIYDPSYLPPNPDTIELGE